MLIFLLVILIGISGIEVDLLLPSFEVIQETFDVNTFEVEWLVSLNLLALAVSSFFLGIIADRYGSKRVLILSMCIFCLGGTITLLVESFNYILVGRLVQGIGIAAPMNLPYVILAKNYSVREQQSLIGIINGFAAVAISIAPVIGSYLTLHFGWRSNLVSLLIIGIIGIIVAVFLPHDNKFNEDAHISWRGYLSILKSAKTMHFIMVMAVESASYWAYLCMAPIFYMVDMNLPLSHFGFYQGALAAVFAFFSIANGYFFKKFGHENCFIIGLSLYSIAVILMFLVGIFKLHYPLLILIIGMIWAIGAVVPVNYMWPLTIKSFKRAEGKITSLFLIIRLILTSVAIQTTSFFHQGEFITISIMLLIFFILMAFSLFQLYKNNHIQLKVMA